MDETEGHWIRKWDAAELQRSEVYPALLRLRAVFRWQTSVGWILLAWVERIPRSLDTSAP